MVIIVLVSSPYFRQCDNKDSLKIARQKERKKERKSAKGQSAIVDKDTDGTRERERENGKKRRIEIK